METIKPLILINSSSKGGMAENLWRGISTKVMNGFPEKPITYFYEFPFMGDSYAELNELIDKNRVNTLISAGGDGSINFLVSYLIDTGKNEDISVGAIGLGSSNDFHKPFCRVVDGIPLRVDCYNKIQSDLGKVEFTDCNGIRKNKYFIINASLGVTAEANYFFNNYGLLQPVKKRSTKMAIMIAAIRTILKFKNFPVTLEFNGDRHYLDLTNLSILKNPHISGDFRYDQEILPGDGKLGLNFCCDMNILDRLNLMKDLGKGCFKGKPKRFTYYTTSLRITTDKPVAIETDGEVELGMDFEFSILPGVITTLGSN